MRDIDEYQLHALLRWHKRKMARYSTYRTEAVGGPAANKGARTVMRALAYPPAALKVPTFQCKIPSERLQFIL